MRGVPRSFCPVNGKLVYSNDSGSFVGRSRAGRVRARACLVKRTDREVPMHVRAEEVLVVDDDEAVRTTVSRVLTRAGFRVDAACNADEALEIISAGKRFDVIVTDLLMPGMHGIEFLRRVRRIDLDVPLIVLTGNPTLETAVAVVEYGGFRYLEKPVSNETLCETVRSAGAMASPCAAEAARARVVRWWCLVIGDRAGLDARFDRRSRSCSSLFADREVAGGIVDGHEALCVRPSRHSPLRTCCSKRRQARTRCGTGTSDSRGRCGPSRRGAGRYAVYQPAPRRSG